MYADDTHLTYADKDVNIIQSCLNEDLLNIQNRAARALTFSSYDAKASQLFQNLNWKNLSTQHDIQKALMVFKSLNGLAPEYLSSKFISARSKHFIHVSRFCK